MTGPGAGMVDGMVTVTSDGDLPGIPAKLRVLAATVPPGGVAFLLVAPETLRQMAGAMERGLAPRPGGPVPPDDAQRAVLAARQLWDEPEQSGKPQRDRGPLRRVPLPVLIFAAALCFVAVQIVFS